jgi:hypothetical protein
MQRQITDFADVINPRGNVAKELERSAKQAAWLSVLCEYWLSYNGDNPDKAAHNPPTYDMPKSMPNGKRFNKARKECGAFAKQNVNHQPRLSRRVLKSGEVKYLRGGKDVNDIESIPAAEPRVCDIWDWRWVFNHWLDGGLDRSIDIMLELLPDENREKLRLEMLK